jgi:hypothetical protein
MAEIRAYKATLVSGSTAVGKGTNYPNTWGIMRNTNVPTGSMALAGGGSIDLQALVTGQVFPCYVTGLTITGGSVYVLE